MSGSRWGQPGVPHKGRPCVDVVDLRADAGLAIAAPGEMRDG
ncbi:MAG TPA: hypothetical protein PK667_00795 [Nitrosomonas europaea]|nr:hypothetical protein [Nitrosomonas europaea]SDW93877.1 hypothetical protein SAMN05216310_15910 [Nitrosomonas europaea]SET47194.1 hypothetical protein SAMN05216309_15910 [Nitrosomonas europaea]SKA06381.1 hypothetical protein SAMN02745113_02618 [Nitrosomonas europaea]HUM72716.1 hypothetical protein [Nitrosomonas europaea]